MNSGDSNGYSMILASMGLAFNYPKVSRRGGIRTGAVSAAFCIPQRGLNSEFWTFFLARVLSLRKGELSCAAQRASTADAHFCR